MKMDVSELFSPTGIVLSALGAVGAIFGLRIKYSKDSTEVSKNSAERGIMSILRQERDEAMKSANEAWSKSRADGSRIASLEGKNEFLLEQIVVLREQIADMKTELVRLRKIVQDSGHG